MVVGCGPVVVAFLAHFLGNHFFASSIGLRNLGTSLFACPAALVATHTSGSLRVGHGGYATVLARAAAETFFAHVGTPGKGPTVLHGLVHHAHKFIKRQVVTASPAPVVLDFEDETAVEGVVRITGERYVVVGIEFEVILHEGFRCIFHAFVRELGGALAKVAVEHRLHVLLPDGVDFLGIALGDGVDISLHGREEGGEVEQRIAVEGVGVGHQAFGNQTVAVHAEDGVVERTTLAETGITMGAHVAVGAVGVGLADEEGFAEVNVLLLGVFLDDFALEEGQGRITPASTRVVLVLDGRNGVGNHRGEHERVVAGDAVGSETRQGA